MMSNIHNFSIKKKNINFLFWVGFVCLFASESFTIMNFNNVISGGIIANLGAIILVVKISLDLIEIYRLRQYKEVCVYLLALLSGVLTYILTENKEYFFLFVVLLAVRNINFTELAKFYFISLSSIYATNIFLIAIKLRSFEYMVDTANGHKGDIRYFLGFGHPNQAMEMYALILMYYILVKREHVKKLEILFWAVAGGGIYYLTKGRCGFLAVIILIVLYLLKDTVLALKALEFKLFDLAYVMMPAIMIAMGVAFNGERLIKGKIISTTISRVIAWGYHNNKYGISLFGKHCDGYPLDCSFYKIIFCSGIVGTFVFVLFYIKAIKKGKQDYIYNVAMFVLFFIFVFSGRITLVTYALPVIYAYAKQECTDEDDSILHSDGSHVLSIVIPTMVTFLVGHELITWTIDYFKLINGPTTMWVRCIDLLLLMLGAYLGGILARRAICSDKRCIYKK